MMKPIEGAKEKLGRCVLSKSEQSASLDFKNSFTVIAEQMVYVLIDFISIAKSDFDAWISSEPVYVQNLCLYNVLEDQSYGEKL